MHIYAYATYILKKKSVRKLIKTCTEFYYLKIIMNDRHSLRVELQNLTLQILLYISEVYINRYIIMLFITKIHHFVTSSTFMSDYYVNTTISV